MSFFPELSNPLIAVIILVIALILDILYPFHKGILLKIHPVHTCYVLAFKLVKPYASRIFGVLLWIFCVSVHVIPILILINITYAYTVNQLYAMLWIIMVSWILKTCFSITLLVDIGLKVYRYSAIGDWSKARYWTQQIVRRDVYVLDEEHVLSACIESLAESLVDGIISPLFYYPFLGVVGALIQRLANTLDGAVGFKTKELRDVGWFSAKMDTIINFIPARLTAFYIITSSLILKYDWRNALKVYLRDRRKTESVNAGHPMSAMAGALGIRLEKMGYYALGDRCKPIDPLDVLKAVKVIIVSTSIHLVIIVTLTMLIPCQP